MRALAFIPPYTVFENFSASRIFAAVYPEAVNIAALLASPAWRALAAGDDDQLSRFTREIGHRIGDPNYQPRENLDAIAHWIEQNCWRPPSAPPHTFPETTGHARPSQVATHLRAQPVSNLGLVLYDQGEFIGARTLFERALEINEARFGPDYPHTAWSLDHMARVLRADGDLDSARPLYERALAIHEARLGPDHPLTAWSLNNLATVLRAQGDLKAARTLHERALHIRETRLGPDHPTTVRSRKALAGVVAALEDR